MRKGEKGIPEEEEKDNEDSKSVKERLVPSFLSVFSFLLLLSRMSEFPESEKLRGERRENVGLSM